MGRRTKGGKSERRHEVEQKIQKASEGRKVGWKDGGKSEMHHTDTSTVNWLNLKTLFCFLSVLAPRPL